MSTTPLCVVCGNPITEGRISPLRLYCSRQCNKMAQNIKAGREDLPQEPKSRTPFYPANYAGGLASYRLDYSREPVIPHAHQATPLGVDLEGIQTFEDEEGDED